jgi:RNA polymerase sigma-70 factor (ECF subfamily)
MFEKTKYDWVEAMAICLVDFLEESRKPLKNYIKNRINNDDDAEDILQDVLLKLTNNIDKLMDSQRINAWIYKITRNAIIDYYRRNRRFTELERLSTETPLELEDDLSSNSEIAFCLKNMVEELPDIYKQAIVLTAFENHTQKEYSEMAGISLSGAKSRVQRARTLLKEMVLGCCSLEFDRLGNIIEYKKRSTDCQYC